MASLTKYIAGSGNVMGGALISLKSKHAAWLRRFLAATTERGWRWQTGVLVTQAAGYESRMETINRNTAALAGWLRAAEVERLPSDLRVDHRVCPGAQDRAGNGGLCSLIFGGAARPSPFPMRRPGARDLRSERNSPWLFLHGARALPRTGLGRSAWGLEHLVRLAIGIEPVAELQSRLEQAFTAIR